MKGAFVCRLGLDERQERVGQVGARGGPLWVGAKELCGATVSALGDEPTARPATHRLEAPLLTGQLVALPGEQRPRSDCDRIQSSGAGGERVEELDVPMPRVAMTGSLDDSAMLAH